MNNIYIYIILFMYIYICFTGGKQYQTTSIPSPNIDPAKNGIGRLLHSSFLEKLALLRCLYLKKLGNGGKFQFFDS